MTHILHKTKDGWTKTQKQAYKNESELQDILSKDVNTLPFEDMGYSDQFVTIGKEVSLENGYLDLLAVSPQGQIVIIETKLDQNPEVKRTVVGQALGYASYLWNKNYEDIENYFKQYLLQEKIQYQGNLSDYLKEKFGDSFSESDFKEGIEKRLRLGSFSILIVVDKVNDELKNIANYLNDRTGQEIDFYIAQMELIGDKNQKFLVPRLANPYRKSVTKNITKSDDYDRTPIAQNDFVNKLSGNAKQLAIKLLDNFQNSKNVKVTWRKNGFSLMTPFPEDIKKPGGYNNFSYLFFEIKDNSPRLTFSYPNEQYDKLCKMNEECSPIKKYVEYFRSLSSYEDGKITAFELFDDLNIQKLISKIKSAADKLN